jgi:hypothetical protein
MVKVSGLGNRSGGGRVALLVGLATLIGAAIWFAATHLGK